MSNDKIREARDSLVRIEKYLSTQPAEYCGNMDNHFSAELASIEAALTQQPESDPRDGCELECGAYGTYCRCKDRAAYERQAQQPESEPKAVLCREIGETTWFDHNPLPPEDPRVYVRQQSPQWETCTVYPGPQPSPQVPEGYVLMPTELTREMWAAAGDAVVFLQVDGIGNHDKIVGTVWEKLKQAAPYVAKEDQ